MNRAKDLFLRVINSLWFFPALLIGALAVLAVVAVAADLALDQREGSGLGDQLPWIFKASPESARAMLGTIAGALITAAGVTFSGVLVALSIASSQYTSRILSSFTADRLNQFTVGLVIGAFVYCIVVLRTVGVAGEKFVPEVAVAGAVLLGGIGVCILVLFVHSVATAIQAHAILDKIASETIRSINVAFPEEIGEQGAPTQGPLDIDLASLDRRLRDDPGWISVTATRSGYLRTADLEMIFLAAQRFEVVIRMDVVVGSFIHEGVPLASYLSEASLDKEQTEELRSEMHDAHTIGSFRTVEQDPAYGLRQLVDIALRALSPGINDTTTAVMAIERITQVLAATARREKPSLYRYSDQDGKLRLCIRRHDVASLAELGYEQIRLNSHGNAAALSALYRGWLHLARTFSDLALKGELEQLSSRVIQEARNQAFIERGEWPEILEASRVMGVHV